MLLRKAIWRGSVTSDSSIAKTGGLRLRSLRFSLFDLLWLHLSNLRISVCAKTVCNPWIKFGYTIREWNCYVSTHCLLWSGNLGSAHRQAPLQCFTFAATRFRFHRLFQILSELDTQSVCHPQHSHQNPQSFSIIDAPKKTQFSGKKVAAAEIIREDLLNMYQLDTSFSCCSRRSRSKASL